MRPQLAEDIDENVPSKDYRKVTSEIVDILNEKGVSPETTLFKIRMFLFTHEVVDFVSEHPEKTFHLEMK